MKEIKKNFKKILVVCTTDSMIWNFLIPHIKALQSEGYIVECACSKTGVFFSRIQTVHNLNMHCIDFQRNPFQLKNFKAYHDLQKLIRIGNYGLVFCHEPVGGAMGRLVGKREKCKIIYMAHGFHFYRGCSVDKYLYYWVERCLAKKTDYLLTINNEDYVASLKFKCKYKKKINGIGLNLSKFDLSDSDTSLREELHLRKEDIIVLSVGELIRRKNHEVIIRSMARNIDDNVYYVIVGDGELLNYLNKLIVDLKLEKRVFMLGYREDIPNLCKSCDIFALPSLQEGLSVALMEAMASGKPIIGSKIRGNIDLIDDRKGGILVDKNEINQYTTAIKYLSSCKDIRIKYGKYNMVKVKDYSIEKVVPQIISIFRELDEQEDGK